MRDYKENLSSLKILYSLPSRGGNEDVWNIFVQILLPLVLVMTFVAVVTILKFKDVAKVREKEVEFWRQYAANVEKKDKEQLLKNLNSTTKELQRIYLLNALDKVRIQKRHELKLDRFFSASNVKLEGQKISDDDFKELCRVTRYVFYSYGRQRFKEGMYREVLKISKVKDTRIGVIKVHRWPTIPEDRLPPRLYIISRENRARIHNSIMDAIDAFKNEVMALQIGVLHRIFEYLINHPETLDNDLRRLAERLSSTRDEREVRRLASTFYREVVKKRQKRIKKEGYVFLDETWNQFMGPTEIVTSSKEGL